MQKETTISQVIAPEDAELMIPPKRSCNHCYGRGFQLWLKGDGYTHSKTEGHTDSCKSCRLPNPERIAKPCHCTFRNAKFRLKKK